MKEIWRNFDGPPKKKKKKKERIVELRSEIWI